MSQSSSYKVITPPNSLTEKVSWNEADNIEQIEHRAAQWIRVAENEAKSNLIEDVAYLDEIVRGTDATKPIPNAELLKILRAANDIRTQASSFDFDHLVTIATAVCMFVDGSPELAAKRTDALLAFSDAMKTVASHVDGGGTGKTDKELADAAVNMLKALT